MAITNENNKYLDFGEKIIPQLSIDCVVFGFHESQLKILLLKWKGLDLWSLPGGFIEQTESIKDAAKRILEHRTGLKDIYLEMFSVFGDANRKFEDTHRLTMESQGFEYDENHWICKRFVSIGYYALVDFSKAVPSPDENSDICDWFDVKKMPKLWLDHQQIFDDALVALQQNLDSKLTGFNLLPETFTMNELQNLYETILDTKLIRSNFQRKMLSLNILERIEKKFTGRAHKAPFVYRFIK